MDLKSLNVRMTAKMFEDTKRMADDCRIPHAEWVRRSMCLGTFNQEFIRENRCVDEYKVPPRGLPEGEY